MTLHPEENKTSEVNKDENDEEKKSWSEKLDQVGKTLNEFRKIHYVELLILLFNLAQGLRASANFPSFYSKVCHEIYRSNPSMCLQLDVNKTAENIVQTETARWLMYNEIVTFLPNLVTAMFFGSFGDKYGRKLPTLIAISSMVVHNFLYMLLVSIPFFSVYSLTIEACLIAFGGTKTVFVSAQYAEAAHQTKDKTKLTQRFSILTACISCAIFVAGNLSPILLKYCSLDWIMLIGQIVMTVALMLALVLHSPSKRRKKLPNNFAPPMAANNRRRLTSVEIFGKTIAERKSYVVKPEQVKPDHREWFDRMLYLYQSAWKALTKRRPNNGRTYLLLFCFVGLIYSCADSGMDTVITLYVYHAPISWTPSVFSRWMATMSMVQLIGGVLGTHFLKRFKLSDYTVLMVGLLSAVLKMICTSIASETWMMYLAVCLGCVSNVGVSSLRSLIAQLGDGSETGELTSMLSIVMGWAQLSGSLICNNIYTATVHSYPGFTFAVVAFLLFFCFFIVLFVFCHVKKLIRKSIIPHRNSAVFYLDTL